MAEEGQQTEEQHRCAFCPRPAIWHFGTELWQVGRATIMGQEFFAGETIWTCGHDGLRLRRWMSDHADAAAAEHALRRT